MGGGELTPGPGGGPAELVELAADPVQVAGVDRVVKEPAPRGGPEQDPGASTPPLSMTPSAPPPRTKSHKMGKP